MNSTKERLRNKLREVEKNGVSLFLEGKPATPDTIAGKCICEDMVYMADYVLNEDGVLKELRYDKITER